MRLLTLLTILLSLTFIGADCRKDSGTRVDCPNYDDKVGCLQHDTYPPTPVDGSLLDNEYSYVQGYFCKEFVDHETGEVDTQEIWGNLEWTDTGDGCFRAQDASQELIIIHMEHPCTLPHDWEGRTNNWPDGWIPTEIMESNDAPCTEDFCPVCEDWCSWYGLEYPDRPYEYGACLARCYKWSCTADQVRVVVKYTPEEPVQPGFVRCNVDNNNDGVFDDGCTFPGMTAPLACVVDLIATGDGIMDHCEIPESVL